MIADANSNMSLSNRRQLGSGNTPSAMSIPLPSQSLFPTAPDAGPDTPGSSIFDLPTHQNAKPLVHHSPGARKQTVEYSGSSSSTFVVISGGTGCNSICSAFGLDACYVLPISDDGGSSSEIIRVLGGPSIGDIRSRLVRLIPYADPDSALSSIRGILAHRLLGHDSNLARDEWRDIVEGRSKLWTGIPNDRKELVRGFLVYFESEVLKRAHKNFSFENGSVGNYFLAAAQRFFRSLPSAIFLFSSITNSQANILPVIVTNHTVTLAAELNNGTRLVGQCAISHPVQSTPTISVTPFELPTNTMGELFTPQKNVAFESKEKDHFDLLESPVSRIYYINAYGNEIHPSPNPEYISSLAARDCLVYSCGSLWTSIMPCLALRGVASAIARSHSLRAKVLLLNSENDRETHGYTAVDYINGIVQTLNAQHHNIQGPNYPTSAFITHLVYLKGTEVLVDVKQILSMGVHCVEAEGGNQFDSESVQNALHGILTKKDESL